MLKKSLVCLLVATALAGLSYCLKMADSGLSSLSDLGAFLCAVYGIFGLVEWAVSYENKSG